MPATENNALRLGAGSAPMRRPLCAARMGIAISETKTALTDRIVTTMIFAQSFGVTSASWKPVRNATSARPVTHIAASAARITRWRWPSPESKPGLIAVRLRRAM